MTRSRARCGEREALQETRKTLLVPLDIHRGSAGSGNKRRLGVRRLANRFFWERLTHIMLVQPSAATCLVSLISRCFILCYINRFQAERIPWAQVTAFIMGQCILFIYGTASNNTSTTSPALRSH